MMLKKSYIYLILTVVALLAAACSKAPELTEPSVPVPDMTNIITFDMLGTKVTNDDIINQEFIIYDYVDGVQYIDGSKYTLKYSEGAWRFFENSSGNAVDFYWTETGTHEFFAYNKVDYYWGMYSGTIYQSNFTFEYNGASSAISTSSVINMLFPTDGDALQGCYQDLIYASASRNVTLPDGFDPVSLEFKHAFASVQVTVRNNSMITKNIEGLSLAYIRCNTGPGNVNFSGTVSFDTDGELGNYPSSGKMLAHGDEWEVFDTPVIVLRQTVDPSGHTIQWTENGEFDSIYIADFGTASWDSGKLYHYVITLDPTALILAPTATIEHTEDAGGDKFSVVNVNLNAPAGELQRITNLVITVTDSDKNVIKTYEAATVGSNEISMECGELLPPGTYTVSVNYHDGLGSRTVLTNAESAVQPALGYYVNIDGTFSETFVSSSSNASGYSIARIFYIGDPSEEDKDTQLKVDYPYCTRGLAYEVDGSGSIVDNRNWDNAKTSWNTTTTQKQNTPDIIKNNSSAYTSVDNIHGYSNTVAIKSMYNSGFISAVDTSSPCVQGVTSPWYIASLGELKEIKKQTNFTTSYSYYIWTSTIAGESGWIDGVYYNFAKMWSIYWIDTTGNTASAYGSSAKHGYVRILAF